MSKWDYRFLHLAEHVSDWSKDPRTKVGAVIVDPKRRIVSLGFNGLPRGVTDDGPLLENREIKLQTIIHAETNAIMFAHRDLAGCTIYTWPMPPCSHCAAQIVQAGIVRVVSEFGFNDRWSESFELAKAVYGDIVQVDLL